jgi:hypothetical protein
MKNNKILSPLLWLFVAVLSVAYFTTEREAKELKAISETNFVTEKASKELLQNIKIEMDYFITNAGTDPRDRAVLDKIKENDFLLDSLYKNDKLNWNDLSNTLDTFQIKFSDSTKEILNYKNYASQKIETIHQNLLYQTYQYDLRHYENRVGDFYQMFSRNISLTNLDSTIAIYEWNNKITSQISVSPNLDKFENHSVSFNFNKSDTVIFEVVTEFYNKQRETERKQYRITSKINSQFDYEEIE